MPANLGRHRWWLGSHPWPIIFIFFWNPQLEGKQNSFIFNWQNLRETGSWALEGAGGGGTAWFSGGTERGISRHNSNSDFCFYEVESHTFDFGFRSSICGYRFKIFPFRTSDLRFRTFQFGVLSSISDLRLRILEIWFRSCFVGYWRMIFWLPALDL